MILLVPRCRPTAQLLAEAFAPEVRPQGRDRSVPQRGEKRELVEHALTNAREALGRQMAESSAQGRLLAGVCEAFGLEAQPERIEVYDNSHIMGTNAVGGMIVAGPEGFQKNQYRKFNIKSTELTPGDDYGMMREVLRRRFARLVKEEEAGESSAAARPGAASTAAPASSAAAQEVMADLGVDDIAVVGVAKGPDRDAGLERFFMPGKPPFMLEPKSPVLYYLQRLRDEAHRFAIGTHRTRRRMEMTKNPLGRDRRRRPGPQAGAAARVRLGARRLPRLGRATSRRSTASARRWRSASSTFSAGAEIGDMKLGTCTTSRAERPLAPRGKVVHVPNFSRR